MAQASKGTKYRYAIMREGSTPQLVSYETKERVLLNAGEQSDVFGIIGNFAPSLVD
jgi:hypothetical protein